MSQLATSTDHLLKSAIEKELAWAPDVTADHIGVGVLDGTVTLSGQVTTYPEKKAAVAAVLRVRGVTGVADEVVVQHHYGHLEDSDIAREATTALRASVVVPKESVKATVQDHHVRLVGTVPWHYQRETAAKIVGALPGVVAVLNDITVAPQVTLSESQAEQQIRAALVRNAQVDSRTIHVKASGSTIELTGTVQSWAEFRQASHAAWATPGVTHVRNRISVIS
jgi:osmotically-inducible protein OsmY